MDKPNYEKVNREIIRNTTDDEDGFITDILNFVNNLL